MIAKVGVLKFDRPKVKYQSPKDDSNLASIDERRQWGDRHLRNWTNDRLSFIDGRAKSASGDQTIDRVVDVIRRHSLNIGLCFPHSVVACELLNRLGRPAKVMMIGEFQHFYVHVDDYGPVDVFPNYSGPLLGAKLPTETTEMMVRSMSGIINEIAAELEVK